MTDDKSKFVSGFSISGAEPMLNLPLLASQPQIEFKLPDGPYTVIEDPPGVVHVFAEGRAHPILIMSRDAADKLGWIPDPPTSGVRLSSNDSDEEEDDG